MERVRRQRHHDERAETAETATATEEVDMAEIDELLAEIDEVLEEHEAAAEAQRRRDFKAKMKTINFIIRRTPSPCEEAVRLPRSLAEALVDAGLGKDVTDDCEGC